MKTQIYVIGHRNPDTDSIASSIAYAELKKQTGYSNVSAAMAGEPNPQTRYILERLQIEAPLYLADIHPRVRDIINRRPITVRPDMPLKEVLELFHRHTIRVLPVVDESDVPVGVVSLLKLSEKYLLAGTDQKRGVDTSINSLATCLKGTLLTGVPTSELEHLYLFIGAMQEESFTSRIDGYDPALLLIMTGDRPSIQQAAVEKGVRLLVVTGGLPVGDQILERARELGVAVISTSHDTATAAWLARLSTPLASYIEPKFAKIGISESLDNLRLKLLHSGEPAIIAVEEDGAIAGVATKSSLLAPLPYALILVDHNELSQAVPGAEAVEILEVVDHHKLGNAPTSHPITFMVAPVGSTCTLVALLYRERSLEPEQKIAALLLAGILSDTVILKSPTTTDRDREIVLWLENLAGLEHLAFGRDIFSSCSGFSSYGSPYDAVKADFKQFNTAATRFGVGQIEVVGFTEFYEIKEELREALKQVKKEENLHLAGMMVTDIYTESTLFLAEGKNELAHSMGYPQLEPHLYELKGVMSRKKQMVPHLLKVLGVLEQ
ncbi:MAG TPA: putative manganese-dependent inorganic diphosphatase [Desulfuromonadaceae bacterium]|jgi:manganese-dependent inorganic pyrophosphatase